jgi:hypothetical protein
MRLSAADKQWRRFLTESGWTLRGRKWGVQLVKRARRPYNSRPKWRYTLTLRQLWREYLADIQRGRGTS